MIIFDSPNKRKRKGAISILVIHYTEIDFATTKKVFLDPAYEVSAHLVIDQDGTIYRFVQDHDAAYHAGNSHWGGLEGVNDYSIGIELVHPGFSQAQGIKIKGDEHLWIPYDGRQIDALIQTCKDYSAQYNIAPENIVGHSDIAPWRYDKTETPYPAKRDPGPLFPWRHLYNQGIGRWYTWSLEAPAIHSIQSALSQLGYRVSDDPKTIDLTLKAFQMHYRPQDITGIPDQETLSIMAAILSGETSHTSPG
mgnify:CR=1 FL=1